MSRGKSSRSLILGSILLALFAAIGAAAQEPTPTPSKKQKNQSQDKKVRTMTIPISIFSKEELKENAMSEFIEAGNIFIKEDGDQQSILSMRSVSNTPLYLSVIIQDDLESVVNLELKNIANFIRKLPKGSRVMVGYLRAGGLQIRQKFTEDLEKASSSLRILGGSSAVSTGDPYDGLGSALDRYEALPTGRRAVIFISDGFDSTSGIGGSTSRDSVTLERAISKAQRRGIAVYSIYSAGALTRNAGPTVVLGAQGALNKLADETGGKAFFQGTSTPVNYDRFLLDLDVTLTRQFALTYLSTHINKGYHRVEVYSSNPEIKIEHPKGYRYRGR
jgi:VWFA-related protein